VMSGVPRVYEKLRARAAAKAAAAGGAKRAIFEWAGRVAESRGARLPRGKGVSLWLALQSRLADRLVFAKIRAAVGGRLRFAVSGSAPLGEALGRWYYGVGIPILEGYGLTETSPVLTVTPLGAIRFGTVGPPLSRVELRIAADGEVLARGPNVMSGYYRRPADTAQAIQDGWFHTGDIGQLDESGYLKITDRKKELLVTSGGKKIAPQPIEQRLRAHPLVSEAVVVGERRHFASVLLIPEAAALSAALGLKPEDALARLDDADVRSRFQEIVDAINRDLSQFERLKKFELIGDEWTVANGTLTPTMKVKRRVVEERYAAVIERMYEGIGS